MEDSLATKHSSAKGSRYYVIGTAATVAGAVFAVKKTIIEPEEKKLTFIEETVKSSSPSCKPLKTDDQGNLLLLYFTLHL